MRQLWTCISIAGERDIYRSASAAGSGAGVVARSAAARSATAWGVAAGNAAAGFSHTQSFTSVVTVVHVMRYML